MADFPKHAATVNLGQGQVTTADTSRTAPTTPPTVFTAGANGSIVNRIRIKATATLSAAGTVRFFLKRSGSYYLLWEIPMTNTTAVSATVPAQETEFEVFDCNLMNGDTIVASTEKTDTMNIFVFGADY